MKNIRKIGIIGSGKMGSDIASLFEEREIPLVMVTENSAEKERHESLRDRRLGRLVKNGLIAGDELDKKKGGFIVSENFGALAGCDLVIEAVPEAAVLKQEIFGRVEKFADSGAILATNSSSIDPSVVFSRVSRKDRCAGLHFFYPARLKNIMELIHFPATSSETVGSISEFFSSLGRRFITLPESEGFILNRVFLDFQALGFWLHLERGISVTAIDNAVRKDLFPDGLFSFFDSVGLDVMLSSIREYARKAPSELYRLMIAGLERMIAAGMLGRKSGRGFYDYGPESGDMGVVENPDAASALDLLRAAYINGAFRFIERKACTAEEMDYSIAEYMGVDAGPVALAASLGHEKILAGLYGARQMTGSDNFIPSALLG